MSNFFETKIQRIWEGLASPVIDGHRGPSSSSATPFRASPPPLATFAPASEEEVIKTIKSMSTATCQLDPMPTTLVKKHLSMLAPTITTIVNASLSNSSMPASLKTALVKPRLKKGGLDPDDPKSYRPISNLPFVSKVIERIVSSRLTSHMMQHDLHEVHQSAYKAGHSTESALLKVTDDILQALDKKKGVLMVLLDLSAAFDTVAHEKLLEVLSQRIGLSGSALEWFRSYLDHRTQTVVVGETSASPTVLTRGVPQGSVLGPVLFTVYTLALGDIVRKHRMESHFYADDTQLYATFDSADDVPVVLEKMEKCVVDVKAWMAENCLQLNDAKTELICFTSKHSHITPDSVAMKIGDTEISSSRCVRI